MNIIEFLLNNIYFVIVVLFFIFKIFSRSKTGKGNAMPTFGGDTSQTNRDYDKRVDHAEDDKEDDLPYQQYEVQDSQEQRRRAELQRLQEEEMAREHQAQRTDQLREEQRMRHEQQQRAVQAATMHQVHRNEQEIDFFEANELSRQSVAEQSVDPFASRVDTPKQSALTAGELRKAVLWSEVLSAPRAKRPYRR